MTNNDLLRSLRYALKLNDKQMLTLFSSHPHSMVVMGPKQLSKRMASEDDDEFSPLSDEELTAFLDGLIVERRGLKENAAAPVKLERLSHNDVLKKLRIALEFKEQDMLETLEGYQNEASKLNSRLNKAYTGPTFLPLSICAKIPPNNINPAPTTPAATRLSSNTK